MQVGFEEIKARNTQNKKVKLYVIVFVFSHSRYKYGAWQERPFITRDMLRYHENAFEFFGGRTEEIVYNQDRLITVSKDGGDIIYILGSYNHTRNRETLDKKQRDFRVHICRVADPESKSKVEKVVKFIKGNYVK